MYKRCIFMLADGARVDVFNDALAKGDLPNIQRHIIERGSAPKSLVTCFPSITGPAYIPFLMGCYPSTVNIPAIRWFDRTKYRPGAWPWGFARSYIGPESMLLDRDMRQEGRTVFEIIDHASAIFCPVRRGIKRRYDRTPVLKHWYMACRAHWTDNWQWADNTVARKVQKILREDFQFIYAVFPAIDEYSHFDSIFGRNTCKAYRELDRHVGDMVRTLKETGRYDETLLAIASDHGLTDTHTHFELWDFMNRQGYDTFHYPKIFKRKFDAVSMASGNAMGHLYVRHEKGWQQPTHYEDLSDSLVPALIERPEIDIILSRMADGSVHVDSDRGAATITPVGETLQYQVERGEPFGFPKLPAQTTNDESLHLTINEDYPDALLQASRIFQTPRCGDVVVTSKMGYDLRDKYESPEHSASHGTLHKEHMRIPFFLSHNVDSEYFRTVDVFPTLLDLLGIPWQQYPMDGVSQVTAAQPSIATTAL